MPRLISLVLLISLPVSPSLSAEFVHRAPDDFLKSWVEGPIRLGEQRELTLGLPNESSMLLHRHTRLVPVGEAMSASQLSTGVEAWRDYYTIQPRTDGAGLQVSLFRDDSWKEVGRLPECILSDSEWFDGALYFLMRPSKALPTSTHLYRSQVTPSGTITPPVLTALAPPGMILEKFAVTRDGLFGVGRFAGDERRRLLNLRGLDTHTPGWSDCGEVEIPQTTLWDITSRGNHLVLCSPLLRDIEFCGVPGLGQVACWERRRLDQGPWHEMLARAMDRIEASAGISPRIIHQFSLPQPANVVGVRMGVTGQTSPRLRWRLANAATEVYGDWSKFTMEEYVPVGEPAQFVQYEIRSPEGESSVSINEVILVLGESLGASESIGDVSGKGNQTLANARERGIPIQVGNLTRTTAYPVNSPEKGRLSASRKESDNPGERISGRMTIEREPLPADEMEPVSGSIQDWAGMESPGAEPASAPDSRDRIDERESSVSENHADPESQQLHGEPNFTRSQGESKAPERMTVDAESPIREENGIVRSLPQQRRESTGAPGTAAANQNESIQQLASSPTSFARPGNSDSGSGTDSVDNGEGGAERGETGPSGESAGDEGNPAGGSGPSGVSASGEESGESGPQGHPAPRESTGTGGPSGSSAPAGDGAGGGNSSGQGQKAQDVPATMTEPSSPESPEQDNLTRGVLASAKATSGQAGDADKTGHGHNSVGTSSIDPDSNTTRPSKDTSFHSKDGSTLVKGTPVPFHSGTASIANSNIKPFHIKTGDPQKNPSTAPSFLGKIAANFLIPLLLGLMLTLLAVLAFQELRGQRQPVISPFLRLAVSPMGWEEQKQAETAHANQLAAESTLQPDSPNQALHISTLPMLPDREKGKVEWRVAEPLPRPMAPATAFYHHGAVYVVDSHGTICHARLRADGSLCPWGVRVGRLPSRSVKGVVAFADPFIVCISGGEVNIARIDGENLGEWRLAGKLDCLREVTAAVGMGNRLFCVGGGSKGNPFPTVRSIVIDNQGNLGEIQCHPPLPMGVSEGTLVASTNSLYWLGGMCQRKVSRKVFSARVGPDDQIDEWKTEPDLPWGQRHPTVESWGGALWVVLNKPMGEESVVYKGEINKTGGITSWKTSGRHFREQVHAASLSFVGGRFLLVGGWMKSEGSVPRTEVLCWDSV